MPLVHSDIFVRKKNCIFLITNYVLMSLHKTDNQLKITLLCSLSLSFVPFVVKQYFRLVLFQVQ
jgi:hypothetical protein